MRDSFQRISRATKGEQSVEDLQQQSFVIAHEISASRGSPLDFTNPENQELLIRYVKHRNVKRGDWAFRKSARILQEYDEDDNKSQILSIPAAESADPLVLFLHEEEAKEKIEGFLVKSYSQATAYLLTFMHFNYDAASISAHLEIAVSTLTKRVLSSREIMARQPSLFDRIVKMERSFIPLVGTKKTGVVVIENRAQAQYRWDFE